MKQLNDRNTKSTFPILSIMIVAILYCTGCQKEDMPVPMGATNNSGDRQTPLSTSPLYTVIKINHSGGFSTSGLSYDITVMSNGVAVFNGYRNVAKIGEVKFEVPREKMLQIAGLIKRYEFFSIEDDLSYIPDLPCVTTTCTLPETTPAEVADHSRSLIDYNKGYPAALIGLRTDVELVLNISSYVNIQHPGLATAQPAQE